MPLTEAEEIELLTHLESIELEKVSPKLEAFRRPARIKVCYGGRGAGAKSWSIASLLVQRAHRERLQVLCTREIQLSLEESVYRLVTQTIERLGYPGWTVTKECVASAVGSRFYFRGLRDMRAAAQIKGHEGIDIAWIEEGAMVSGDSLDMLVPTIRRAGSEIWISFNREAETDAVYERFVKNPREDAIVVWLEPGAVDNPWWSTELETEMVEDYKRDPDQAEHIWGGQPRKQGQNAVMSRTAIRGAMDRSIAAEGAIEVGVDVARFGDDLTVMYKRQGLKVIDCRIRAGQDVVKTANDAMDFAGRGSQTLIKVDDDGVGGGVTDILRRYRANVVPVGFGRQSHDKASYASIGDEMWFTFPIDGADIPNDPLLMQELAGRQYGYDNKGRRKVEAKKDFKKRLGRSPDRADALLLTFYNVQPIMGVYKYLEATGQASGLTPGMRGRQLDERWHLTMPTRRA